jgi:hypothetical protein
MIQSTAMPTCPHAGLVALGQRGRWQNCLAANVRLRTDHRRTAVLCDSAQTDRDRGATFRRGSFCDPSKIDPMNSVWLYVDGVGRGWAIVRCNSCSAVDVHPALDALNAAISCKCGLRADVRDSLIAEMGKRPEAPPELKNILDSHMSRNADGEVRRMADKRNGAPNERGES